MDWFILLVAGLFEIGWAIGLKYTDGFTRPWPVVWTILSMTLSVALLGVAMKTLPVGTAYAVWVGIGASLTVAWAMLSGSEPASPLRMFFIIGIVGCVIGLKLAH